MASSTLTSDRRSARKVGMTILGKIAVPKPVNLPSQRLENHGLDPNLEIVPKGTLTWGSRSSSTTLNAWGSSALSPSTPDGSASSRLTGRPSSGGSGTRPSTAGSDKSHEPAPNAWGPNSRSSSAGGVLASSQTLVSSARPRSAETRPSSSQLSRFAESVSENSSAWSGPGTAEKLGTASSKVNGFTLSSGDFPTLGSEKSSELLTQQGDSSHGRPVSASGREATQNERLGTSPNEGKSVDASAEKGNIDTWKRDTSPCHGGVAPSSMEKWQRGLQLPQPHPNVNMPPHHIDHWHGLPIRNPPVGVWYRGGQPRGPYGPAGPPGGYSLDHFGYYHSQLPARPTSNPQAGPRPGVGPDGCQPKHGDVFRPHLPDSYAVPGRPVIPVRPGVYPGPLPYDGYYAPPHMNFCNSNERDVPPTGMAVGPCVYNRYPNQNVHPDTGKFHVRPVMYGPTSTMANEQMTSGHSQDTHRGPYKVLLKQHDGWGERDAAEGKREQPISPSSSHPETANLSEMPRKDYNLEGKWKMDEQMDFSKSSVSEEVISQSPNDQRGSSSVPIPENLPGSMGTGKPVDDGLVKRTETAVNQPEGLHPFTAVKKNTTLIDKIEGLNTKARSSDWRYEVGAVSNGEEMTKRIKSVSVKADSATYDVSTSVVSTEKALDACTGDKSLKSTVTETVKQRQIETQVSVVNLLDRSETGDKGQSQIHKRVHGMQGRMDYRGKGRFNVQDGEEWRKKSSGADFSVVVTAKNADACVDTCVLDHHASQEAPVKQESNHPGKNEAESCATPSFDSTGYKAQRAKLKEIATQRARQLQKEEEERIREQKAKALAKLEELDRRTLAEHPNEKLEKNDLQHKQQDVQAHGTTPKIDIGIHCEAILLETTKNEVNMLGESTELSLSHKPLEVSSCDLQAPVVAVESSVPLPQDANATDYAAQRTASQLHPDHGASRQKHMGCKRKQNNSQGKNVGDKTVTTESTKANDTVIADESALSAESSWANNTTAVTDALMQYKKKTNRSIKNKHKLDELSLGAAMLPLSQPIEWNPAKASSGNGKVKSPEPVLETSSVEAETPREIESQAFPAEAVSTDHGWSQPTEESHVRVDKWKPQPSRRMSRSTQAIRPAEKFHGNESVIWAPVRSPIKNEPLEEACQNATADVNHHHTAKNGHGIQNSLKSKRVEMERYVPKPVVKEQSQQNSQKLPTSSSQDISDEMSGKVECGSQSTKSSGPDSSVVKAGFTVETKNGESKHNRHGKTHASWRQRGLVESPMLQQSSFDESTLPSATSKIVEKPIEQDLPLKPDIPSPKGQEKHSDSGWNAHDLMTKELVIPVVKDHGTLGRGKRQPYKVHRGVGHKHTPAEDKDAEIGATDKTDSRSTLEPSELGGGSAPGAENQGVNAHASSHGELKSQAYSSHNRQGGRGNGGQRVPIQEFSSQGMEHLPSRTNKDSCAQFQSHPRQHDDRGANVAEIANAHQREYRRERKVPDPFKEHADFPNQGPASLAEQSSENINRNQGQHVSSGPRRHGHHNARLSRRQEPPYGGGQGPGPENRQQPLANRDGRHHNTHYEYLPIGSYEKPSNMFHHNSAVDEEAGQGSRVTGSRYRERGQNQSRRGGHFYRRNNGGGPDSVVQDSTAQGNGE